MPTAQRRVKIFTAFALLILLFSANAWIIYRQLRVQIANDVWVSHTQSVLFKLNLTESLLKDAETGQRGFLYTGRESYLVPYDSALMQIDQHLAQLGALVADNPAQSARVSELRRLSGLKLNELTRTINLYKSGHPDHAKAIVLSGAGIDLMGQVRALVDRMIQEENGLSSLRTEKYETSIKVTVVSIFATNLFGLVCLSSVIYLMLQQAELKDRYSRQMEEREQWFRSILTSAGDGVLVTNTEGLVNFANSVAEEIIGAKLTMIKGKPIEQVFRIVNEYTRKPVDNPAKIVIERGVVIGLANHTLLQKADGTYVAIEDSAAPIRDTNGKLVGVVMVFRDATEKRQSAELMRKTEKLAAAARLAATVSHEINNPLEAIGNLLYLARRSEGLPPSVATDLDLAQQELERISHITKQTLGFYRETNEPDQIQIPPLIDSVLNIHSNKFKAKSITIKREYSDCPPIRGMSGELKQVLANLVSNAADAVPHGGMIRVQAGCIEDDSGKTVEMIVEDDGPGIAPEHMERIFEPFFTTKKDIGTGLGLWVSKEIVSRHGGSIEVLSGVKDASIGAAFRVTLPITDSSL